MSVPCKSCGAEVVWRVHVRTGRPAPIDVEPNPAGPVVLVGETDYAIVGVWGDAVELVPRERYMPHFATCPTAAEWRGKGRS